MSDMLKTVRWQRSVFMLTHIVLVVVSLAALYFLRDVFVPLALGLTVDSFCRAEAGPWKSGANPEIDGIGTWVGV